MRRLFILLFLANCELILAPFAPAQDKTITSSVCEVARDPAKFDNKLVRLRATLAGNFEISAIRDPDNNACGSFWFAYPGGGPDAVVSMAERVPTQPRPVVHLKDDHEFRRFRNLVDARMYAREPKMICMDCKRYEVTALMVGLVEFAGTGHGFGHMNAFQVQFVLQSIEQTSVKDLASNYKPEEFSTAPIRFPTGYIKGTLVGPDGQPIPDGDLNIYSASDPSEDIENDSATTDRKGRFMFAVPPGAYIIGFNTFWPPSPKFPFPPTYYPSAQQRSEAKVLVVGDRRQVGNIVVKLPRPLVPRTISVKIIWPDGKPVADANVWLSQVSDPTAVVGISVSQTSVDGTFDLIGFEGVDYVVHADKYSGLAHVSCAKNALVRAAKPIPTPIQLPLTITDYNVCTNTDFEVPTEAESPR